MQNRNELSKLPAVDRLLALDPIPALAQSFGHAVTLEAVRVVLEAARREIIAGAPAPDVTQLAQRIKQYLVQQAEPSLRPVINASGVILHTNLGRAPLSAEVVKAMMDIGPVYCNLEYDLDAGRRGSRYIHAEGLLTRLTGAEAALLVNNNAAAVLLCLAGLASGREVIISRGQLVEIGGGFRIPDVLAASGARLVEVGTTNRTYLADYQAALSEQTAVILRVHQSNFRQQGFVHQTALSELAELAHSRNLLLVDDLGSGTLLATEDYGLPHEPTIQESLQAGADLVTFSGDKLLGGPQAGIIVGRAELIARLRQYPLTRALRVDKSTIAGIQANLLHYVRGDAPQRIPVWQMIAASPDSIRARAAALMEKTGGTAAGWQLLEGRSMIGGGALPEESLPTWLLALAGGSAQDRAATLRKGDPPVVARVENDLLLLDFRTVLPEQETALASRLSDLLQETHLPS